MFYKEDQIQEIEDNAIILSGEVEFAKTIFAGQGTATFEKSQYPIDCEGNYQAVASISGWFCVGELKKSGEFITPLGSWNYLILDLSKAQEASGLWKRMDEIEQRQRDLDAWRFEE